MASWTSERQRQARGDFARANERKTFCISQIMSSETKSLQKTRALGGGGGYRMHFKCSAVWRASVSGDHPPCSYFNVLQLALIVVIMHIYVVHGK